jgi:hypothetical protein
MIESGECVPVLDVHRVARFFLLQHTKKGENLPNNHKIYQIATKYTKWPQNISNTL